MLSSHGASNQSKDPVHYGITQRKLAEHELPEGVDLAEGVRFLHKSLKAAEATQKTGKGTVRGMIRDVVKSALTYTESDEGAMTELGAAVHEFEGAHKEFVRKLVNTARGYPSLNIGQPVPRTKLPVDKYVLKYFHVIDKYGFRDNDKATIDAMMLPKKRQVILAVKKANTLGVKLSLDELMSKYKASKATRKPTAAKAGSTAAKAAKAPKAPQTPEDLAASMWKTTVNKGENLPPQFAGFVAEVDLLVEITAMGKWCVLFQRIFDAIKSNLWQDSQMKTTAKAREAVRSGYTEVLRLKGLIDQAVKKAGKDASMTEVVKHVGEDTMMAIITFMRMKMGFRPKTTKSPAPDVSGTEVNTIAGQPMDMTGASASGKQPDDGQPDDCNMSIVNMGEDAIKGLQALESDDSEHSQTATTALTWATDVGPVVPAPPIVPGTPSDQMQVDSQPAHTDAPTANTKMGRGAPKGNGRKCPSGAPRGCPKKRAKGHTAANYKK